MRMIFRSRCHSCGSAGSLRRAEKIGISFLDVYREKGGVELILITAPGIAADTSSAAAPSQCFVTPECPPPAHLSVLLIT